MSSLVGIAIRTVRAVESVVVGLGVAEAAGFTALLRDKGGGTFSAREAAAAGSALGIRGADAGDELRALGGNVERDYFVVSHSCGEGVRAAYSS